jgi:transcriptional regulator with XRE-family HTH domain
MNTERETLPRVIGANFKAIREQNGVTQSAVASWARQLGLKWNAARVGDFERGRSRSPFGDVLAALLALDNAIGAGPGPFRVWHADGTMTQRKRPRVKLADLVEFDGFVSLTDDFTPTGDAVAEVCSGKFWELYAPDTAETADVIALQSLAPGVPGEYGMRVWDVADMRRRSDVTETRVARRLGIDTETLMVLSWRLFGRRTFSEERDRRAAGNPARRGPVSRELRETLEEELARGNH